MSQIPIQRVGYDKRNDIVYIAFSDQWNSYGNDISDHVTLRRNWDDDHITGVTIFHFMRLLQSKSQEIQQLPFDIDFKQQVVPFCKQSV